MKRILYTGPVEPENRDKKIKRLKNDVVVGCEKHATAYLITDQHSGDLLCSECGYVIQERIICDEAEWRDFNDDTKAEKWAKSRVGGPENPFLTDDANLGTIISSVNARNNFSLDVAKHFKRRSVDNALKYAFKEIQEMSERINLTSSVIICAKKVYHDAYKKFDLKGVKRFLDAKVPAAIYIACRLQLCPRTSREITAISEIPRKEILNASNRIMKVLSLKLCRILGTEVIGRICGYLGLSNDIRKTATQIANRAETIIPKQVFPETVAGASIYVAILKDEMIANDTNQSTSWRKRIGEVAGISDETIHSYVKLLKQKGILKDI